MVFRTKAVRLKQSAKAAIYRSLPSPLVNWIIRHRNPRSAQLEVTTACNLDCPLCFTHVHVRGDRFMKMEQFDDFLQTTRGELNFANFHINGEPMIHQGLFEMIRRCTEAGVGTGFSTNGMLIDQYLDKIFDSGLSFLSIAIDGINAEDYSRYRQGGKFDKVVANTKLLIEEKQRRGSKLTIQLQTIMFPYNEEKEDQVVAFLESFGADEIRLKQPSYLAEGEGIEASQKSLDFLASLPEGYEEMKFARPAEETSGELYKNLKVCPQLERAAFLSDGRVVACCMDAAGWTTFGDLNEEKFADIWSGPKHKEVLDKFMRKELELCKWCTLSE